MNSLLRLFNALLFVLLPTCVYVTFSVKNNVHDMQRQALNLKMQIAQEKEMIDVYRVQWATIASTMNISDLQKKLLPDYQTITYQQMQNPAFLEGAYPADSHVASVEHGKNRISVVN